MASPLLPSILIVGVLCCLLTPPVSASDVRPMVCDPSIEGTLWRIPSNLDCNLPTAIEESYSIALDIYQRDDEEHRLKVVNCMITKRRVEWRNPLFGKKVIHTVYVEMVPVSEEDCRQMSLEKRCAYGVLNGTIGNAFRTNNEPKGAFKWWWYDDPEEDVYQCEAVFLHAAVQYGHSGLILPLEGSKLCDPAKSHCQLLDRSMLVWNATEVCPYRLLERMNGTLYSRVDRERIIWSNDEDDTAISFPKNPQHVNSCGLDLVVSDQGYAISFEQFYELLYYLDQISAPGPRYERRRRKRDVSVTGTERHAATASAQDLRTVRQLRLIARELCRVKGRGGTINPTKFARHMLHNKCLHAEFATSNILLVRDCECVDWNHIEFRAIKLNETGGRCYRNIPIYWWGKDSARMEVFLDEELVIKPVSRRGDCGRHRVLYFEKNGQVVAVDQFTGRHYTPDVFDFPPADSEWADSVLLLHPYRERRERNLTGTYTTASWMQREYLARDREADSQLHPDRVEWDESGGGGYTPPQLPSLWPEWLTLWNVGMVVWKVLVTCPVVYFVGQWLAYKVWPKMLAFGLRLLGWPVRALPPAGEGARTLAGAPAPAIHIEFGGVANASERPDFTHNGTNDHQEDAANEQKIAQLLEGLENRLGGRIGGLEKSIGDTSAELNSLGLEMREGLSKMTTSQGTTNKQLKSLDSKYHAEKEERDRNKVAEIYGADFASNSFIDSFAALKEFLSVAGARSGPSGEAVDDIFLRTAIIQPLLVPRPFGTLRVLLDILWNAVKSHAEATECRKEFLHTFVHKAECGESQFKRFTFADESVVNAVSLQNLSVWLKAYNNMAYWLDEERALTAGGRPNSDALKGLLNSLEEMKRYAKVFNKSSRPIKELRDPAAAWQLIESVLKSASFEEFVDFRKLLPALPIVQEKSASGGGTESELVIDKAAWKSYITSIKANKLSVIKDLFEPTKGLADFFAGAGQQSNAELESQLVKAADDTDDRRQGPKRKNVFVMALYTAAITEYTKAPPTTWPAGEIEIDNAGKIEYDTVKRSLTVTTGEMKSSSGGGINQQAKKQLSDRTLAIAYVASKIYGLDVRNVTRKGVIFVSAAHKQLQRRLSTSSTSSTSSSSSLPSLTRQEPFDDANDLVKYGMTFVRESI